MKGLILYFSLTGNTRLALEHLKKRSKKVDFDLYDMMNDPEPEFDKYDVIGVATFADHLGPPKFVRDYMSNLRQMSGKHGFVVNTFGGISGATLAKIKRLAEKKGISIISGHSLRMPQNYPPMRKRGMTSDDSPSSKELETFNKFIDNLNQEIDKLINKEEVNYSKIKGDLIGHKFSLSDDYTKKEMGLQVVNEDRCIGCGKCHRVCPYDAIEMNATPSFDHDKCEGCFACYNHCPSRAIETKVSKGDIYYNKPSKALVSRFDI